jgi:integrase
MARNVVRKTSISENYEGRISHIRSEISRFSGGTVELLKEGTPIENVAAFLGHASVRTTQKHYAAWVKARQERAEADVMASWESDPLLIMERPTKGTYKVHKNSEAVN